MELKYKHLKPGENFMFVATVARKGGGPFRKINDSTFLDLSEGRTRRIASISAQVERIS